MSLCTLATQVAFFNILFSVIPCTASIRHHQRQHHATNQSTTKESTQCFCTKTKADHRWCTNREYTRKNHPSQCCSGCNLHTTRVIGLAGTFKQTGNFTKLPTNFLDHVKRRGTHRTHGDSANQKREDAADKHTHQHHRVTDIEAELRILKFNGLNKCSNDCKRCQTCSTDRKTLTDCSSGVTNFIKTICDLAGFFTHASHLCNTASVVCNRTIGIDRHSNTYSGEHTYRSNTNTVQTNQRACSKDNHAECQHWYHNRLHTQREAGNHYCCRTGLTVCRQTSDWCTTCVKLGYQTDDHTTDRTCDNTHPY